MTLSILMGGHQDADTWLSWNVVNHSLHDPEATTSRTLLVLHRAYKILLLGFMQSVIRDCVKPALLLRVSFYSPPTMCPQRIQSGLCLWHNFYILHIFLFSSSYQILLALMPIMPVMPILSGGCSNEGRSIRKQILKYDQRRRLSVDPERDRLRP